MYGIQRIPKINQAPLIESSVLTNLYSKQGHLSKTVAIVIATAKAPCFYCPHDWSNLNYEDGAWKLPIWIIFEGGVPTFCSSVGADCLH